MREEKREREEKNKETKRMGHISEYALDEIDERNQIT
jgi:hypothetical protein